MDPITILALFGALAGVAGNVVKGVGEGDEAEMQRQLALRNQALAYRSAADARARGEQDVGDLQLRAGKVLGEQRNAIGASGLEASGSALNLLADTRLMSSVDVARARNNASREAWGYEVQADNYGLDAQMAQRRKAGAVASTILGGLGAAAAGGSNVYGARLRAKGGG